MERYLTSSSQSYNKLKRSEKKVKSHKNVINSNDPSLKNLLILSRSSYPMRSINNNNIGITLLLLFVSEKMVLLYADLDKHKIERYFYIIGHRYIPKQPKY